MSYLACHVMKFNASGVVGMSIHDERKSNNSKNKDIDYSRTHENYDALTGRKQDDAPKADYRKLVAKVIEEHYTSKNKDGSRRAIRDNAVQMVSVLVTSDKDFFARLSADEQKRFFETAANFLAEKFGRGNVVAAKVHMDEKTPHMHFNFVPLRDGKLTAKTILDRTALKSLQDDLPKVLQSAGFEIERGIEASPSKHIDTADYKRYLIKQQYSVKEILDVVADAQDAAKKSFFGSDIKLPKYAYDNLIALARENAGFRQKIEESQKERDAAIKDRDAAERERDRLLEKQDNLTRDYEEIRKKARTLDVMMQYCPAEYDATLSRAKDLYLAEKKRKETEREKQKALQIQKWKERRSGRSHSRDDGYER